MKEGKELKMRGHHPQERRMMVLRAVVTRYVKTHEPVGSSVVSHDLPIEASSATVRNDMYELENEGYLIQPHTSAGRIPTQKGYRLFVDRLARIAPLSVAQRRGIADFLSQSVSFDDTLRLAVQLLSRITGQIAVVASPSFKKATLQRFEIIPLSWNAALAIAVTSSGRVEQRTIVTSGLVSTSDIHDATVHVNELAVHQPLSALSDILKHVADRYRSSSPSVCHLLTIVAHAFEGLDEQLPSDKLYMAGVGQLTRSQETSPEDLAALFDALEEQVVVLRLLSYASEFEKGSTGVGVAIGSETKTNGLLHAAIVSSAYGNSSAAKKHSHSSDSAPSDGITSTDTHTSQNSQSSQSSLDMTASHSDGSLAYVGSIGPTRMDYPATMAAVKAVAQYLSVIVGKQEG
jgi:heat-inducible transcriptional repressor